MQSLRLYADKPGPFYPAGAALRLLYRDGADLMPATVLRCFDPAYVAAQASVLTVKGGRGQTLLFTLDSKDLVLRRYLRGGLWGKLMGDKCCLLFKTSQRAAAEFALLERLAAQGLFVPTPLWGLEARSGLWVRNALITYQIPHSRNLAEILAQRALTEDELRLIGKTLARFFKHQVLHTDLNIRNILLTKAGRCAVIDFDKCAQLPHLSTAQLDGMLARLQRSFNKEVRLRQVHFTPQDFTILEQSCRAGMETVA